MTTLGTSTSLAHAQDVDVPKERIGPFVLKDKQGNSVRLTFFAQGLASALSLDGETLAEASLFELRRGRPGLSATFWRDRLRVDAVWNLVPGSAQVIDVAVSARVHPEALIRVGQFKVPLSRYRLNSGADQVFVDWSRTTLYFGGERQRGVAMMSPDASTSGLYYNVGVFSGVNARRSHGVGVPLVYDKPRVNLSSFSTSGSDRLPHPEVAGHFGWASQGMRASAFDDRRGGKLRGYVGVGATYDFAPVITQDATARLSLEGMLKLGGASLYAGMYLLRHELVSQQEQTNGLRGGLIEATLRLGARGAIAGRVSRIELSEALVKDALRVRLAQGESSGPLVVQDEYAVGAKVDVYGESVQLAADLGLQRDEADERVSQAWLGRIQGQVRF